MSTNKLKRINDEVSSSTFAIDIDKDAVDRLVKISELNDENKSFILNMIDMALRDFKTKKAYSI